MARRLSCRFHTRFPFSTPWLNWKVQGPMFINLSLRVLRKGQTASGISPSARRSPCSAVGKGKQQGLRMWLQLFAATNLVGFYEINLLQLISCSSKMDWTSRACWKNVGGGDLQITIQSELYPGVTSFKASRYAADFLRSTVDLQLRWCYHIFSQLLYVMLKSQQLYHELITFRAFSSCCSWTSRVEARRTLLGAPHSQPGVCTWNPSMLAICSRNLTIIG